MTLYFQYLIPVVVIVFIIFYRKSMMGKLSQMQADGTFEKPVLEEFQKHLLKDEALQHFVIASWKDGIVFYKTYYLGLSDKRLFLVLVDPRNASKNVLEVAEAIETIQNISIKDSNILEQNNMGSVSYPAKDISFQVNGKDFLVRVKFDGSYIKNHNEELLAICQILSTRSVS